MIREYLEHLALHEDRNFLRENILLHSLCPADKKHLLKIPCALDVLQKVFEAYPEIPVHELEAAAYVMSDLGDAVSPLKDTFIKLLDSASKRENEPPEWSERVALALIHLSNFTDNELNLYLKHDCYFLMASFVQALAAYETKRKIDSDIYKTFLGRLKESDNTGEKIICAVILLKANIGAEIIRPMLPKLEEKTLNIIKGDYFDKPWGFGYILIDDLRKAIDKY
mgnify:CR=1 FL=1